jgi:hypothetical protein
MYYLYVYTHRQLNVSLLLIQSSELQWLFVITESCLINSSPHFRHSQSPHKFFPPFSKLTFTDALWVHLSGFFSSEVYMCSYLSTPPHPQIPWPTWHTKALAKCCQFMEEPTRAGLSSNEDKERCELFYLWRWWLIRLQKQWLSHHTIHL